MPDSMTLMLLLAGAVLALPPFLPAAQVLSLLGRRNGIDFGYGETGQAAPTGPAATLLAGLAWRPMQAAGCALVCGALTKLMLRHGPTLSRSETKSVLVALVACAGVLGPYLVLRQFLRPFSGNHPDVLRPAVSVEDYLSPARRVVPWLAGLSVLAVPVGAVLLSPTASYDGTLIYWEGLVGLPLVSAGVLLAAELATRGHDQLADPGLVYVWDALRGRSLRLVTAIAVYGVSLSWEMAAGGLLGVAHRQQASDQAQTLHGIAVALSMVFEVAAFVLLVLPDGRFRHRLWPSLEPGQRMPWSAAAVENA